MKVEKLLSVAPENLNRRKQGKQIYNKHTSIILVGIVNFPKLSKKRPLILSVPFFSLLAIEAMQHRRSLY